MLNFVEIGRIVVVLRERKGLTQEKLALEAEMSVIYLRRIERGRANPTLRALDRVAAILGLELSTLLLLSEGGQKSWEELRALCDGEASPHADREGHMKFIRRTHIICCIGWAQRPTIPAFLIWYGRSSSVQRSRNVCCW